MYGGGILVMTLVALCAVLVYSAPVQPSSSCNGTTTQVENGLSVGNIILNGKLIQHLTASLPQERGPQLVVIRKVTELEIERKKLEVKINADPSAVSEELLAISSILTKTVGAACNWIKKEIFTKDYELACTENELNQLYLILSTHNEIITYEDNIRKFAPSEGGIAQKCTCSKFETIANSSSPPVQRYMNQLKPVFCNFL